MKHKCIIIEDQLPAQRILIRYIEDVPELELVETFTDPVAALAYLRQHPVELIFLDIHLPKLSGMDLLKVLPYKPKVILTTAFSEYALKGYEFDVVDYLLKPISFERFLKAVSKVIYPETGTVAPPAQSITSAGEQDHIFVKSDRTIVKITFAGIRYIKSDDDYTHVFTEEKHHFLSYTLKYWLDVLPARNFCRIHKSYIINIGLVEKIEGNLVHLAGVPKALPIGRSFRERFMERIDLRD